MSTPLRILVTGSRDFPLPLMVHSALTQVTAPYLKAGQPVVIVHGDCRHPWPRRGWSVDQLAKGWAIDMVCPLVTHEPHPADWDRLGRGAGFARNTAMVALGADLCLAFIANASRGSTHCADTAERSRIPILRFRVDGPVRFLVHPAGIDDSHPQGGSHGREEEQLWA